MANCLQTSVFYATIQASNNCSYIAISECLLCMKTMQLSHNMLFPTHGRLSVKLSVLHYFYNKNGLVVAIVYENPCKCLMPDWILQEAGREIL